MLIDMRGLNMVTFNAQKIQATVQDGALISDVIAAAYAKNIQVTTGNCSCVGTLRAILGGGYGNLMGLHGFGVDNLISLQLVTHLELSSLSHRQTATYGGLFVVPDPTLESSHLRS